MIPYKKLKNIEKAVQMFAKHFENRNKIGILIDEDVDGFTSAAMMYSYIQDMKEDYPVKYIMHDRAKAHGLSSDVVIPEDIKLLIIPDASTNDCKQCNELHEKYNTDIIILDHHQQEDTKEKHEYAVLVNNQISDDYSNKNLCGAGVVYKFLQALDDYYWNDYAEDYIDLCALANISDVMDMRSFETRYIAIQGLHHIKNKCFQALIDAQSYSMNNHINIHNIQWYITSVINGCIRFGSSEEKELLFRAFIETDESFEYKKRATKDKPAEVIQESIYDRAARLCKNAKSRQDKAREKSTSEIMECLRTYDKDNKIVVCDASNIVDTSLTGVVAMKVADIMNRPCILLQKHVDDNNKVIYGGSARNINHSPIESLKDVVNQTGIATLQGHDNAAGLVDLQFEQKDEFIKKLNELLQDVEYDATYTCDYIIDDIENINPEFISILAGFQDFIGQGIENPIIAVSNVTLCKDDFQLLGKNSDTYKFTYNDIEYVKFKCKDEDPVLSWIKDCWNDEEKIEIELVGKPGINIFNGIRTMQVIIESTNIINTTHCMNDSDDIWNSTINSDNEEMAW
ncbi:hypothetical protein H8S37_03955 [Mediterraneibacter sp. NSJ-55]|uniref:DHH family phosphoesterase n=1 Tax=Mediterraneibacter hominis TaxID=2763054 RepID=A0A923LG40_9FIRM|nr:DHH family phosphoesterase [Mediterraneibacter hominis]MBC5688087.1 hypothetical protein [Mediterraneibacter hominis]